MHEIPLARAATAAASSDPATRARRDTIVVGASAGGVAALRRLLGALSPTLPAAVLVTLHQTRGENELAEVLDAACALPVERVDSARPILPGRVYVAPPDRHMIVAGERVRLGDGPHERRSRPAINPLFRTAAATRGARVIAVQLTGMLDDGVAGLDAVSRCGGLVLVQDPEEAAFAEMPRSALDAVRVDHVATLDGLATLLGALVHELAPRVAVPPDVALESRLTIGEARWQHDDGLGRSLLVALQALGERVDTLERLAAGSERSRSMAASAYRKRADESREHADRLRRFLLAMSEATTPRSGEDGKPLDVDPTAGRRSSSSPLSVRVEQAVSD